MRRGRSESPPIVESLEAVDLIDRIRRHSHGFSAAFRRVADYVAAHLTDVAFFPAARVAEEAGVSESVVIRFAAALGYAGYPEMQAAAQGYVRARAAPSDRFEAQAITESSAPGEIARAVLACDIHNLRETLVDPTIQATGLAVEMLISARRVYVAGFRGLRFLAGLLAFLLDMIGTETVLLSHGDAVDFQNVRRIGAKDVLVTFAFVRYTRRTVALAQLARFRGARVIVITDAVTAPAARTADVVLRTAVQSLSFHNSYVAATSLINALVAAVATQARDRAAASLKAVDAVMPSEEFERV
jgi:DNA-binding MurR/RpiR family transcriptional regulator